MKINDMDFFHQATMEICGSLNINTVLNRSLAYLKGFMPSDSLNMEIYDAEAQCLVNIAMTKLPGFKTIEASILLSIRAREFVEAEKGEPVEIINHPEEHVVGRYIWESLGQHPLSLLVLRLVIDDEVLGVVALVAKGFDRYAPEHARLFSLLHDPFAVALANTLKHQEVLRLQELLADDNRYLNRQLHHISGDEIIGANFGLKNVMEMVRQVAPLASVVLLLGETGVGKEVIANAIHYSSPRANGPFIKVNCGAIPESLLDSELFGHEKGAFTGALGRKRGRFERADKGTIFLDEIGELPLQAQVRLLRVLQNREVERVGGTAPIQVDIRIIAATHRNLEEMINQGKFREDLWFRLNVFPITIPPLRHRRSDIPALTFHFMEKKAREMNFKERPVPAPGALERLQSHDWPGNVRELENMVERSMIQNMTATLGAHLSFEQMPARLSETPIPETCRPLPGPLLLDEAMKDHIKAVLGMTGGKVQGKKGAAALLGINPSTLRNRMKKLNIPYGRKAGPTA
ncbi:MAG: sigma 54-interacting transcriptional regulator [Desulfobacterium sp.]|nr:sigma 54-interacting transcriptional regulator [Desulfobacterium sp.]